MQNAPVVLITGAAKRIGRSIAKCLHARGFSVAIHHRNSASEAAAAPPARPEPTTIMVNFRLFAGLMSFESILCLDHFCSMGPDGILLSRTMDMADADWESFRKCAKGKLPAELENIDRDRNGDEADPDEGGITFRQ